MLAVYTTIYPAVEPFLGEWYQSLREQTDQGFQLWIGLDMLPEEEAKRSLGGDPNARWLPAAQGQTPAQIRQMAFDMISENCDGVVLVDSDDVMHPTRIEAARIALQTGDLAGCALKLVDQAGESIGHTFGLPPGLKPDDVFPRWNVFGLSNTAWRTALLQRCLPVLPDVEIVDWYLATRAWLTGACLTFDPVVRMDYRQHGSNMVQVLPPYTAQGIIRDTHRVLQHFRIVTAGLPEGALPERIASLQMAAKDISLFLSAMVSDPVKLMSYLDALNAIESHHLWWESVAHPLLKSMWEK